jgi:hypothetical protein
MRWNMFLGALVVSVGLSSQSFGFELLDRMLGLNGYGSNSCCEPQCCEKSCAAPACAPACEPACAAPAACAPACEQSCGCDNGCGHGHGLLGGHRHGCCGGDVGCGCSHLGVRTCHSHDLFGGLRGLFDCHRGCGCDHGCGNGCAEPACAAAPACEPACAAPAACAPACEQSCGCDHGCHRNHCRRGCLLDIFGHRRRGCCNNGCGNGCGCGAEPTCGCNGGGAPMPTAVPGAGVPTDAAPMPPAPMADPQAQLRSQRRVVQASKIVRAN